MAAAIAVAGQYGQIPGDHHRGWVIDQMVHALLGDKYQEWAAAHKAGEDGPNTYEWYEGIAP
jgi:hypothetical protein